MKEQTELKMLQKKKPNKGYCGFGTSKIRYITNISRIDISRIIAAFFCLYYYVKQGKKKSSPYGLLW